MYMNFDQLSTDNSRTIEEGIYHEDCNWICMEMHLFLLLLLTVARHRRLIICALMFNSECWHGIPSFFSITAVYGLRALIHVISPFNALET